MSEKVMIYATPDEIAEGIEKFLKNREKQITAPSFKDEKMTVAEGSRYIDVSYVTLCKWITEGQVPVNGKGRKRFLLKSELIDAYKKLGNKKATV